MRRRRPSWQIPIHRISRHVVLLAALSLVPCLWGARGYGGTQVLRRGQGLASARRRGRADARRRSTTPPKARASSAFLIRARARVRGDPLGGHSAPHGVIVGPDGAPWITDGGQNAIVRVDPKTRDVRVWPLPQDVGYTNLNTLTFDKKGRAWFTGPTATMDASTRPPTRSKCGRRRAAADRTASPPRRQAMCTTHRSPAVTSRALTSRPARRR